MLQAKPTETSHRSGGQAPDIVHEVLRSPGQPLGAVTRDFLEPRFGHDFGRVRVHAGEIEAASARAVRAKVADHVADLVTSEAGPIGLPGLVEEIARIIAPGGTIILLNPESEAQYHDKLAKLTGGTVERRTRGRTKSIETTIVVPAETTTVVVPQP